mgnify:CR=1 FL=1
MMNLFCYLQKINYICYVILQAMAKYKKDWTTEDYEETNYEPMKKKGGNPAKKRSKDNKRKNVKEIDW